MTTGETHDEVPRDAADDVTTRLRALGAEPVPDAVAEQHLTAMRAVSADAAGEHAAAGTTSVLAPAARPPRVRQRVGIAAAFAVGLLVGSTGLAYAGALPGPAQDGMATVLGTVGLDVPRSTNGCPAGAAYKNHGQYVEEVKAAGGDVEAASKSDCGKPEHSVNKGGGNGAPDDTPGDDPADDKGKGNGNGNGKGNSKGKGAGKHAGDPCKGKPPWAGDKTKTDAEKDALEAQRDASCPDDADGDEAEKRDEAGEAPTPPGEVPPTTAPAAPTTPVPSSAAPTTPVPPTTVTTPPPPTDPAISALPPAAG